MRTRGGLCYPAVLGAVDAACLERKRKRKRAAGDSAPEGGERAVRGSGRRRRVVAKESDLFDILPDDLVLCILSKLSATASCPSDFISVLLT